MSAYLKKLIIPLLTMCLAGAFIATKQDLAPGPSALALGLVLVLWLVSGFVILRRPWVLEALVVKELGRMRSPSFLGRLMFGRGTQRQGPEFAAFRLLMYVIFPVWLVAFISASLHSPRWIIDATCIGTLVGTCPVHIWLRQVAEELDKQEGTFSR